MLHLCVGYRVDYSLWEKWQFQNWNINILPADYYQNKIRNH